MGEETRVETAEPNARRVAKLEHELRRGKMLMRGIRAVEKDGRPVYTLVCVRPMTRGRFTVEIETALLTVDIGRLRDETFTLNTLEEAKECLAAETGIPFYLLSLNNDYDGPRGGPSADALLADFLAAMRAEAPRTLRGFGRQRGTCVL